MTNCASCVSRRRSDNACDQIDTQMTPTTVSPQNNIVRQTTNTNITVVNCNHTSSNVIKSSQELITKQPSVTTANSTNVSSKGSMNFVTRISKIILRKRTPKNNTNG
ncbi:unnamed protein product [Didymodactylos carnosus]|uniref:Uncharacterized protein n=1 Tax=Didymodactylos carnosus TaxID=1234261 RepID=A0A813VX80_9BILA|nr:unnamed protein product [Didymodactylos carnosus]CAF0849401.1 unnamed protein product [Didymodactylos carnosus]CAF3598748.1 unnamed protein product [Didymodactylos carnosus]CAF3637036.1 unnamed protein product [Didymodactylos carnosus]